MSVRQKSSAFTLIELLVVIAIIAILAAILFPVFAQARAKARQTSCLSNTKQLNLGFQMYKQDYDESYPFWSWWDSCPRSEGATGASRNHFESLWINAIYPYTKNAGIYACLSDRYYLTSENTALYWWFAEDPPNAPPALQVSKYNMVQALTNVQLSMAANEPLLNGTFGRPTDALVDRPADTLLLADGITSLICCQSGGRPDRSNAADPRHKYIMRRVAYANQCDGTWWGGDQSYHNPKWDGSDCTRHTAGANIGYADGHSKYQRAQRITDDLYMGDQAGG
jgi:prepilin-type N-terminal cleavage/methylation domain-containing protein/prepilin-type processing-associated H-X9-DG protein